MTTLILILQIVVLLSIGIFALLIKYAFPAYFAEKGKNLATKQDVGAITREVEGIRSENAQRLENLAHQNRQILEQSGHRQQLRMAALEKRLAVHQEAYVLWVKLFKSVHDDATVGSIIMECQEWWEHNCLYLEDSVRRAFRLAYMTALNHRNLVRWREDVKLVKDSWSDIARVGEVIVKAVELPPITGAETDLQEPPVSSTDA